jgi:cysteinyl-tRNA synthetase
MHNGMLRSNGQKMAKSKHETLVFSRHLMYRFDPDHLRLYLLSQHYRVDADYRDGALEALQPRFERLRAATGNAGAAAPGSHPVTERFREALDNDFDVAAALDVLDGAAVRTLQGSATEGEPQALRGALATLGFAFAAARGPATGDLNP